MSETIVVLGVGNLLLQDEGVGARAVDELARLYSFPAEVRLIEGGTAGLSLLADITHADRLLVLDAVQTGRQPGTVVRLDGRSIPAAIFGKVSAHQIGLGDILAAARLHGGPSETVVLGVEPERTGLGVELSPSVRRALPKVVDAAIGQLERWGVHVNRQRERHGQRAGFAIRKPVGRETAPVRRSG